MADTGASCTVFDLAFVQNTDIPWRKRQKPVRIVSASGTPIQHAGKAFTNDCSVVIQDSDLKMDRIVPITTEIFNLEEGVDLILGMDWLRANTVGMSWDISDRLNFRPNVGLSEGAKLEGGVSSQTEGANIERLITQEGANSERVVAQGEGAKLE